MFKAFGEHAQGQRFGLGHGFPRRVSVGEYAGKLCDLGQPTAVIFAFAIEREFQWSLLNRVESSVSILMLRNADVQTTPHQDAGLRLMKRRSSDT